MSIKKNYFVVNYLRRRRSNSKKSLITVKATEKGVKAGTEHLNKNTWNFFGSSAASSAASSAEMKALQVNIIDVVMN